MSCSDTFAITFNDTLVKAIKHLTHPPDVAQYCVRRLYCGLSPELRDGGMCMVLQTFADDTERGDFYAVAGYVAPIDEWDSFSPGWHAALKERPRLGFYRTSDAVNLSGQFDGWSVNARDARIAKLALTIPTRNTCGVAAFLSKKDFEEFFTPNFLPGWNNPYYLCATYLIESVCLMLRVGQNSVTKLDFIFDRQGKVGRYFRAVYEVALRPMSFHVFPFLGDVRHEDKTDFLPLQAADMHAGWIRRNKSIIQAWTTADPYLSKIEQREFHVARGFLERLAAYRKEHGDEIKAYWDKVAPGWEDGK